MFHVKCLFSGNSSICLVFIANMQHLELVFQLLVRLQFMYLQYNDLSIVVCTNIIIKHTHDPKQS